MGVESYSLRELIELLSKECGAKYSCLAYADFLREKVLAEGTLQPNSNVDDYKLLMQLLSYNQTESKFHEEIGLVSFKDWELEDLELQLKDYKQNSKTPKEQKINKDEAAIADLKNKNSARIGKLIDALELTTDSLLIARFADYLASNSKRKKDKISCLEKALGGYSATAKSLKQHMKRYILKNKEEAGQTIYDMGALAKRSLFIAFELSRRQESNDNTIFVDKEVIVEQITAYFSICCKVAPVFSLDLIDFLLECIRREYTFHVNELGEVSVNTGSTVENLMKCAANYLDQEVCQLIRVLFSQHAHYKKSSDLRTLVELQANLCLLFELVHRMWIKSVWVYPVGSPAFTRVVYEEMKILYPCMKTIWHTYNHRSCSKVEFTSLLCKLLTNCIYGLSACKRHETKNASDLSDIEKEEVQKLTSDFSELGKKCHNKLNNLDKERCKGSVQVKDAPSVSHSEEICALETAASASEYKRLFLLSPEIPSIDEAFLIAGLTTRRFQERYFDQEIKNCSTKVKTNKVELELEISKLEPSLLDPVGLFKNLQNQVVEPVITKVNQRVLDGVGSLTPKKEEVLEQLVTSSKFIPEDHRLNVGKVLILGLNAKTGADWLIVARSVVAEFEYCLRFWQNKRNKKVYLQDSFDHTEQLVHILGQKNVFYLQLLLCNKTRIEKQLFDLRNRLAHGDITDSQAADEEHNFKFIWHLFFHIVCEFIPEEDLND